MSIALRFLRWASPLWFDRKPSGEWQFTLNFGLLIAYVAALVLFIWSPHD